MVRPFQLVAIGASAGGIEAFRQFFGAMPADSGLTFVVVLHLSADQPSMLAQIIGRLTAMPVAQARDSDPLQPDHVLVIPPGVVATVKSGRLRLTPFPQDVVRVLHPIDTFFDSVATDLGAGAIGIVLSGSGHDGAMGLKAIRAAGGLTLAQGGDGGEPAHAGMPDSAIATGAVDLVLPVTEMPAYLMSLQRADEGAPSTQGLDVNEARLAICAILFDQAGHDFSRYKDKTFLRRVQRRMLVVGDQTMEAYTDRLRADHDEVLLLFRDLLIGVTQFFRDEETFLTVERLVVPRLFAGKGAADTVRVWVPGCATGEEAYSLAMLLREHMDGLQAMPKVQIFATDIDEAAIGAARAGRYPASLLAGLSTERRRRFFAGDGNNLTVTKELRDLCTFSPHSLVRDAPFSRIDLISCRNLLIYLDADLQAAVMPNFHYSLVPHGILLLGSSETVVRHERLFAVVDKVHRIFERREGPTPPMLLRPNPARRSAPRAMDGGSPDAASPRTDWSRVLETASARILERYAIPYAVVTAEGELLHYSSRAGNYLQPAVGAPSRSVFDMVRRGLNLPLRAALRASVGSGKATEQAVRVDGDGDEGLDLTLLVEPLSGSAPRGAFLVVFRQNKDPGAATAELQTPDAAAQFARLETEMHTAREDMQSLKEEHETALEELRSSNEELNSVNEELQSSNEELETSKEEIQSVNEELQTVNAQLSFKIDELDRLNSDLRNLFESTQVATIFLDPHMIIRNFTPEVATIYNLIPTDRGRSLNDIVSVLDYDRLREDVLHVLETLQPFERRVSRRNGAAHYLARILLYRTPDSRVEGTLVTFIEVTNLVRAEAQQQLLIDELNHRVKNMLAVVMSLALRTASDAGSLEQFRGTFTGRLQALSSAYSLLSRERWTSVDLSEIVGAEIAPFRTTDGGNIALSGPGVPVNANAALVVGMAVHELLTNAIKYGALSWPEGRVTINWGVEGEGDGATFILNWAETGGPPTSPPATEGFGMMLIGRSFEMELEGVARFDFRPGGLALRLEAPLANLAYRPVLAP